MKKITVKQEKVIDAVLQAVGQWKDAGAVTPPFFELEGGDEVTMNRVRMALDYLAEVINRMDKP